MVNKKINCKILVTGGAGYIGSMMIPHLLKSGYEVTVFDNFMYNQNSLLDVCYHKKLNIVVEDVRNQNAFKKELKNVDIIIPLAAIVGAPLCDKHKKLASDVNKKQIENLSKWISKDQLILYPVTNSGYGIGQKGVLCTETSPLKPISHYGKTKVQAEKAILGKENSITFRLATVFGSSPRMRTDLLVNDFVYRACYDKYIVLFESHFKRNYIHINDVISVFLHGINNFSVMKGQTYNVGLSSANLSKYELCLKIKEYIDDFRIHESDYAQDKDKRDYIVSNKKIESTNWNPKYSLDDGILELQKLYKYLYINPHKNV